MTGLGACGPHSQECCHLETSQSGAEGLLGHVPCASLLLSVSLLSISLSCHVLGPSGSQGFGDLQLLRVSSSSQKLTCLFLGPNSRFLRK